MKTSIAVAAFVAAAIGIGAVLPVLAQDTPAPTPVASKSDRGPGPMGKMGKMDDRGPGRGGLLMLGCAPDAAERLDVTFVRIQHRLDLTVDQQKLFDAFRTKALTSQTSFANACKTAMPAVNDAKPDLLAQIKSGMTIDQARLTAMTAVLPDFEAFYASLTDAQKAKLLPHQGMGKGFGKGGMDGGRHDQRGGMDRQPAPDASDAPDAPPDAPSP